MNTTLGVDTSLKTTLKISGQQMLGLKMLAKSLPEMRTEVLAEVAANPALEDVDHPLERTMSDVEQERPREEIGERLPEDDFTPGERRYDEEAVERRQAMFDRQVANETLQEHLVAQLPLSELDKGDFPLAEMLIGDIDPNGYYRGSAPDVCMAFDCDEAKIAAVLGEITKLDPPGCGARNARECLRAQLDAIDGETLRGEVAYLIDHLEELAAGRIDAVKYAEAIARLKSLDPHPGRAFMSERDRVEYINPEIHAYQDDDGHWCALTDKRSLPEIRISKKFEQLLSNPDTNAETKEYVKGCIERAVAFRDAIEKRQDTVERIAQAIFDRQQDFFKDGIKALKPLTELEVAEAVKVAGTTVSRTVRDKYAETPQGIVELRRFFVTGIKNDAGETISQSAVLECLKKIVADEDKAKPLSDEKLAAELKRSGFTIARRTVAKYRDKLDIPDAAGRRI